MIALAFLVTLAGYGVTSYGWVLVKGYNVPARAWWNPMHPFDWPPDGNPGFVPQGRIFPGGQSAQFPDPSAATEAGRVAAGAFGGPVGTTGGGAQGQPQGQGAPSGSTGSPVKPNG